MLEKSDRNFVVYRTVNWAEEIGLIAGHLQPNDSRESWLARAARKSGLGFSQIKTLFYGTCTDPKYSIAIKILNAAEKARIQEAQIDGNKLANIYSGAARALENTDPDFHRDNIAALVHAARVLGSLDSA